MGIKIVFYPDYEQGMEKDASKGPVYRELEDLKSTYPDVFALVKTIFTNLEEGEVSLDELIESEIFGKLQKKFRRILRQKLTLKKLNRLYSIMMRIIDEARFL